MLCLITKSSVSSCRCVDRKPLKRQYSYRNIKNIIVAEFESRLWGADITTSPPNTPDAYVDLLESTVIGLMDELAPVQQGNGYKRKTNLRWLSNEAIAAMGKRGN